ncbi:hypothetical protein HAX54_000673 [Datura stramonium]|uniref:Uncharacterized protein n=1 Tax=Datura stramonium TaxID=4076 RepID=A0ABS8T1A8_DATST|nr:hypothetical protein [Datura stramonium]
MVEMKRSTHEDLKKDLGLNTDVNRNMEQVVGTIASGTTIPIPVDDPTSLRHLNPLTETIDLEVQIVKGKSKTTKVKQVEERGPTRSSKSSRIRNETISFEKDKDSVSAFESLGSQNNKDEIDNYVDSDEDTIDLAVERLIQFQRRAILRDRVVTGFGGADMDNLVIKIAA